MGVADKPTSACFEKAISDYLNEIRMILKL
jgi:hypothetical protein